MENLIYTHRVPKTRRKEVLKNPLLKKHKYTVLKNETNRTEKQQIAFKTIDQANLNPAKAWHIRENFKPLFLLKKNRYRGII